MEEPKPLGIRPIESEEPQEKQILIIPQETIAELSKCIVDVVKSIDWKYILEKCAEKESREEGILQKAEDVIDRYTEISNIVSAYKNHVDDPHSLNDQYTKNYIKIAAFDKICKLFGGEEG